MAVPIKKWLDKIPGGIIIVPLFLGCLINTFFPAALQILLFFVRQALTFVIFQL
mgnify:CR=1 FL=1